jgi:Fe-S cluster assembly iron-binding protein IscA
MLTISESAAKGIKGLLAAVGPTRRAGVRISGPVETDGRGFELTPSYEPAPEDQTVAQRGVQVFVDRDAAERLEDKVLDAEVRRGTLRFAVEDKSR